MLTIEPGLYHLQGRIAFALAVASPSSHRHIRSPGGSIANIFFLQRPLSTCSYHAYTESNSTFTSRVRHHLHPQSIDSKSSRRNALISTRVPSVCTAGGDGKSAPADHAKPKVRRIDFAIARVVDATSGGDARMYGFLPGMTGARAVCTNTASMGNRRLTVGWAWLCVATLPVLPAAASLG
jgi:hypothetical protein